MISWRCFICKHINYGPLKLGCNRCGHVKGGDQ